MRPSLVPSLASWRTCLFVLAALASCTFPSRSDAQTPITLFQNFVGRVNYQATGGTLRAAPNTSNACSLVPTSTAPVAGIPAGATIRAAYLYWAGSGATVDGTVTLNGNTVTAGRTFTNTFPFNGTTYPFFSGFANVTALVAGNGTYTFSGLTVNSGAPHCAVQAVVSGWSLIVVYAHASEDLRAVNIFDGFQLFHSSALSLTVNTFRIPPAPINGKVTHVTWEGDPQNSGSSGGFSESLTFNGSLLDDGLIPPASSPAVQQFDGTVNTLGVITSHGVDVDTYDVSAFLSPGDTSATTTYSSGSDLVLLSAEVISFTTEPVVDLEITKSHTGNFVVGTPGDYAIRVRNLGPENEPSPITVTDTLPAGLSYQSGTGTGWGCSASGQTVTCVHPGPLAVGATLPILTLRVGVGAAALPAVTNTAAVSSPSVDSNAANNSSSDPTIIVASDLSSSTKSVVDLNGADADPGDVLRYTISLQESAGIAASGVSVTDDIPPFVTGFSVVSVPPGSTNASTGTGTGANGNGFLNVSGISVPASGNATIVFDVIVAATANPGDIIANQVSVANPNGIGATPSAPNVIVSQSQIPSGGTKALYLYDASSSDPNGFNQGPLPYLSRTPPSSAQSDVTVAANTPPVTWTMTPALQAPLTIDAGSIPVTLLVSKGGAGGGDVTRTLTALLDTIGGTIGPLGLPVTQTFAAPPSTSPLAVTFNIPLASAATLASGTQIRLTLVNTTSGGGGQTIRVFPTSSGLYSRIEMPALTVINVDGVASFGAPYPAGAPEVIFTPGAPVSLRADVSDPFGTFDISSVTIDVLDNVGASVHAAQSMALIQTLSGASAQYEFTFALPATAVGTWTYRVTATEGTEGIVTHQRSGAFSTAQPQLTMTKSVTVLSDPANGTTSPKAIPGAVMLYSVTVSNSGAGGTDAGSVNVSDALPAEIALFVDTSAGDPIVFVDGSPSSGLTFDYATAVRFSNQPGGGPPYTYTPTPDGSGFDPLVTGLSINPLGALAGDSGSGAPEFTLRYRARVE